MTRQQNKTPETISKKTNARMEAISDEMTIATEAHVADATGHVQVVIAKSRAARPGTKGFVPALPPPSRH